MMNNYFIPVHFYEQDSQDDELVMFITKKEITDEQLENFFKHSKIRHMKSNDENFDQNELVDAIFNELAEAIKGVWCYCKTMPQLVIGEPEDFPE
jgi:hypothetical protein